MQPPVIDSNRIQAMVAQLRAAAARPEEGVSRLPIQAEQQAPKIDFANVLKNSLDQVNAAQLNSRALGERFASGDDSVNLSDAMIAMQKSSIAFQATIQVRNKLVSAYQDIMNMPV